MGISRHHINQLRDYRSEARSLVFGGFGWILRYFGCCRSSLVGFLDQLDRSGPFQSSVALLTVIGLILGILSFWLEHDNRNDDRVHKAWSVVAAHGAGYSGLKDSLEFLHKNDVRLAPIKVTDAELYGVQLPGADLYYSHFKNAELSGSNLTGTHLKYAKMSGAKLFGAKLSDAQLSDADLSKAKLAGANLSGAVLIGVDFSEANLGQVDLTGANLNEALFVGATLKDAIVDSDWSENAVLCRTTMPDGSLSDRDCPSSLEERCHGKGSPLEDHIKPACNWLGAGKVEPENYADALTRRSP